MREGYGKVWMLFYDVKDLLEMFLKRIISSVTITTVGFIPKDLGVCKVPQKLRAVLLRLLKHRLVKLVVYRQGQRLCDVGLIKNFYSVETEPKKDSKSKTESKTGKKSRIESLKKLIDKVSGGVIKCETPTPAELGSMIEKTCAKYKCSIHRDLCSYMVERCGNDSALLINEARKVAEYKGSGIISKADIDLMTCATPDAKVFDLSAKISAKDKTGAFAVLQELRLYRFEVIVDLLC